MISNNTLPQFSIKTKLIEHSDNRYSLIIEPLLPGFGYTLGNSLRRVFLSSIPGFAVTKVRINDLTHEYQPVEGVVEDVMDIILNIKLIRAKIITDDDKVTLRLKKDVDGDITAGDFERNSKVEIVNQDLYICHLNAGSDLDIEIEISRGVGYLSIEKIDLAGNPDPHDMLVDALFSPVTNFSIDVEKTRVGDNTNFDKIDMTFDLDKSVDVNEVVKYAFDLIIDMFQKLRSSFEVEPKGVPVRLEEGKTASLTSSTKEEEDKTSDEESEDDKINLPDKTLNILAKHSIVTNKELQETPIETIKGFSGLTGKAIKEIEAYIEEL